MLIQSDRRKSPLHKALPPAGVANRRKAPTPDSVALGQPIAGNKVTPLLGGDQIFPMADQLVRGAQSTVQLQMYRLGYDKMIKALADVARQGKVKVQVLLDPTPGYDAADAKHQAEIQKFLTDAGVEILKYPVNHSGMIDHVKLLIVDGKKAIIGGMNWDQHSPNNLDADVEIEGPAVGALEQVMSDDWKFAGGKVANVPKNDAAASTGDAQVRVLTTNPDTNRTDIQQALMQHVKSAKKSIHMMAFSLADKDLVQGLIDAKKRGVDVKVLMDPGKPVVFPNEKTCKLLLQNGIDVRWLDVNMTTQERLHAKLCEFDGDTVILGSSNFTHNGFAVNHEADVEIQSPSVGNGFENFFQDAWKNRSLKRAPDEPDWQEKSPSGSPADQVAQKLVGYFKDNYTPGDRSRWNDDLKMALAQATKSGAQLKGMPAVDLEALKNYIEAGPHATGDDAATRTAKIKFLGDLAGYLTADPSLFKVDPAPGDSSPLWQHRLDVAQKAGADLPKQVPHLIQFMLDSVQSPDIKDFVKEAFDKVPHEFYMAPSSSTGKFHPADEVDYNTLIPEYIQKKAEAAEHPNDPQPQPEHPYQGGGLVLHSARVVQMGKKLCDFFGIQGRDRDQILAGLALHDIMKFATVDAVKATPPGHDVPWTPYTTADHGPAGALWVQTFDPSKAELSKPIAHYIDDHMATWNATPTPPPDINDLIVSLSDYVASLPNFYVNV